MCLKTFFVQVPKTQQIQLKNSIKLLSCQSRNKLHQPGQWVSTRGTSALPWGAPHHAEHQILQFLTKALYLHAAGKIGGQTPEFLQNLSLFQHLLHAFQNVSHMTSPSFTWPQYFRIWVFCCRHGNNLQGHQEHPPTVTLRQALLLPPAPTSLHAPASCVPVLGEPPSSLHGLKPSLKNRVCMVMAPQGILSQVQLYWLKHLPQENLDTETLMGPYILGLCNILFYLFIVFINRNASLTAEMNSLSNYSHL